MGHTESNLGGDGAQRRGTASGRGWPPEHVASRCVTSALSGTGAGGGPARQAVAAAGQRPAAAARRRTAGGTGDPRRAASYTATPSAAPRRRVEPSSWGTAGRGGGGPARSASGSSACAASRRRGLTSTGHIELHCGRTRRLPPDLDVAPDHAFHHGRDVESGMQLPAVGAVHVR